MADEIDWKAKYEESQSYLDAALTREAAAKGEAADLSIQLQQALADGHKANQTAHEAGLALHEAVTEVKSLRKQLACTAP